MVNTISNADREKICKAYNNGNSINTICKAFDIKRTTVHEIVKKFLNSGLTESQRKGGNRPCKLNDEDKQQILEWVDKNCSLSMQKISNKIYDDFHIRISKPTVMKILKQFHYSLKRIHCIPERRNNQLTIDTRREYALEFVRLLNILPEEKLIFIDEVGFNVSMRTGRGRSLIGTPATLTVPSLRSRNISICCAMNKNGIICYSSQTKPFNSECFHKFIQSLMQNLKDKNINDGVCIMDNVSFHKSKEVQRLIKDSGYSNLFLPPYSTFLNPIENMFNKWKKHVRRENPQNESHLLELINIGSQLISSKNCEGFFTHIFSYIPRCLNSEEINDC